MIADYIINAAFLLIAARSARIACVLGDKEDQRIELTSREYRSFILNGVYCMLSALAVIMLLVAVEFNLVFLSVDLIISVYVIFRVRRAIKQENFLRGLAPASPDKMASMQRQTTPFIGHFDDDGPPLTKREAETIQDLETLLWANGSTQAMKKHASRRFLRRS